MLKSILGGRRLLWVTYGIFAGLFFLATPASAAPDLTPQQQLEKAKTLTDEATVKATLALETGDLALAQEAQALVGEAADIIAAVAVIAADTGDTDLAQAALNASVGVSTALGIIGGAAETIAATSTDPATVAAANALAATVETSTATITTAQEMAIASGATMAAAVEAYEAPDATPAPPVFNPPVVGGEPPVSDLPAASPV